MKASVTVVIVKCELTYIQLAASISHALPLRPRVHRGSMNRPSALLEPDELARVRERLGARPSVKPRTSR